METPERRAVRAGGDPGVGDYGGDQPGWSDIESWIRNRHARRYDPVLTDRRYLGGVPLLYRYVGT